MFESILVPVDGSDSATRAAEVGHELARRYAARLDVLHVLEAQSRLPGSLGEQEPEAQGQEILDDVTDRITEDAAVDTDLVDVDTHLVEGEPHEAITDRAAETDSDLVVMGRHGRSGVRERFLGTVTDRVLRQTTVPVLTVPDGESGNTASAEYDDILLTTDGSENAEGAAPYGGDIAQQFEAPLHLLNVVDVGAEAGAFDAGGVSEDFIEQLEEDGHEAVEQLAHQIDADVPVQESVERGTSDEAIAEYADENGIDLIVMASEGESNLASQSLGSVTDRVLRTAEIPVLVVFR